VLSPDGKLLLVTAGTAREQGGAYTLKFDAYGAPELTDRKEGEKGPFWVRGDDKQVPAWREWALGEPTRFGRELPGAMAFSPDSKRLFVAARLGRISVFDTERRALTATLFTANSEKGELPPWHILTANGECVGSAAQVDALVKGGKVRDAAKVREALGAK
jgi:hypothetical protein